MLKTYHIKPEVRQTIVRAIKVNVEDAGEILAELKKLRNDGKPLNVRIEDGKIITQLWGGVQEIGLSSDYYFVIKNNNTYPCEGEIFRNTYQKIKGKEDLYKIKERYIQAVKVNNENVEEIRKLIKKAEKINDNEAGEITKSGVVIHCLRNNESSEGDQLIRWDENKWLIKGIAGELYTNTDEDFNNQYIECE